MQHWKDSIKLTHTQGMLVLNETAKDFDDTFETDNVDKALEQSNKNAKVRVWGAVALRVVVLWWWWWWWESA